MGCVVANRMLGGVVLSFLVVSAGRFVGLVGGRDPTGCVITVRDVKKSKLNVHCMRRGMALVGLTNKRNRPGPPN